MEVHTAAAAEKLSAYSKINLDACRASYGDESAFPGRAKHLAWLRSRVEEFPDGHVLAYDGSRCVGQLELQVPYGLTSGYVNLYYVVPDLRGRGIGRGVDRGPVDEHMRRAPGFGFTIFLIANQQYRDIRKGPARLQHILHPDEICSDNSLHICRAATPQVLSLDTRRELGVIGFGFHYVKMTCQQDFI